MPRSRFFLTCFLAIASPVARAQQGASPTFANIEYAPAEPATSNGHKLDLYIPAGVSTPIPVVIWTGGSAWRADTGKNSARTVAGELMAAGYAVVGVSIRSTSQVRFPGQLHDIKAAIRWLRVNAARYKIDPDHTAIMGDSSGAWTTAMAALTGDAPGTEGSVGTTGVSSAVQAAVAFYPPTNFVTMDAWALRKCAGPQCHDSEGSPESQLVGCPIQTCPEKVRAASPMTYISAADPPIMIFHGQSDPLVPHNQGEQLYMALNKACRDAVFISLPKAGHGPVAGFLGSDSVREGATMRSTTAAGCAVVNPTPVTPTWRTVVEFLDKYMKPRTAVTEARVAFPLRVSENGRYLVDRSGKPFFINGDSPWEIAFRLTKEEARIYLDTRSRQGFNTLLVDAIPYTEWSDHLTETNREGQAPFLKTGDFGTPNEEYFRHLGWLISEAESRGILMMLVAADLGSVWNNAPQFNASGGMWHAQYRSNGVQKCAEYAQYLGRTFRNHPNIVWVLGGDRDPADVTDHVRAMAHALRETAPDQLVTYHAGARSSSVFFHHEDWLALNMSYGYTDPHTFVAEDYSKKPPKPALLAESGYEGESNDGRGGTPQRVRRQFYWAALSGACGHLYGSLNWKVNPDWRDWLDTPGVRSVMHFNTLMTKLPWQTLEPARAGSVIASGEEGGTTLALAAWTPEHDLAIVYLPTSRRITIDTVRLKEGLEAVWFDPASGRETAAKGNATAVTGFNEFTPPAANASGDEDWLLLFRPKP